MNLELLKKRLISVSYWLGMLVVLGILIWVLGSQFNSTFAKGEERISKYTDDENACIGNLKQIIMSLAINSKDQPLYTALVVSSREVGYDLIVSAEKVLQPLLKKQKVPLEVLVPPGYTKHATPINSTATRPYEKWGSGYNTWRLTQKEWEKVEGFQWKSPKEVPKLARSYLFPLVWDKSPKSHNGKMFFITNVGTWFWLPEDEFNEYLKAAIEWVSFSHH